MVSVTKDIPLTGWEAEKEGTHRLTGIDGSPSGPKVFIGSKMSPSVSPCDYTNCQCSSFHLAWKLLRLGHLSVCSWCTRVLQCCSRHSVKSSRIPGRVVSSSWSHVPDLGKVWQCVGGPRCWCKVNTWLHVWYLIFPWQSRTVCWDRIHWSMTGLTIYNMALVIYCWYYLHCTEFSN